MKNYVDLYKIKGLCFNITVSEKFTSTLLKYIYIHMYINIIKCIF